MKHARIAVLFGISVGFAAALAPVSARADDVVRWKTVIGIIQAGNAVGNIGGGGQPWSTTGGEAKANLRNGHVEFNVRGLVLAGGNTIGTPGAIDQVKGTLICNAGATNDTVDTPLVPLSPTGDAQFSGDVVIPAACSPANIAFLVRIAANRWIANGAVRQGND
ncbi:MAG TPA: hypothetical protein VFB01_13460 [Burkholderiales bacterium]|nr:hypothetical protein [Burkholderiales bacterium]